MAKSRQRKLFEELGLLSEPLPPNPYDELGITQELAHELLTVDKSGETLRALANSAFRALHRLRLLATKHSFFVFKLLGTSLVASKIKV